MNPTHTQSGFTIVELIVVILLIAALAAVALPRFLSVDEHAHSALVDATGGALQTAVTAAHSVWRLHGGRSEIANLTEYADGTFNFNAQGFPFESADALGAHNARLGPAWPNANMCGRIWNGLLNHSPTLDQTGLGTKSGGTTRFYFSVPKGDFLVTAASANLCEYTYREKPTYKIAYDPQNGIVSVIK
ncbi:MAG: prepilin-type N-terminal cleavage/methylation domain-containing protein [Pseudomonadales bacterium]|nr:prepilin-type N-terminal cleavage/methylation domain-containing protein [Pseudomonadales bacterium]